MADSQRKSYNLFDKTATDTDKGYLNNQRLNLTTIENSSNVAISEYISVDTSAAYYTLSGILTSGQYNASLAFYDNQYNPIQGYRYQGLASIRAQVPENAAYLRFTIIKANIDEIMLLKGYYATAEIPPYEPYGWVHSLRKLTTATEAVENPLYSDGTAITAYTLKGNEEHTGTPSPSSPVMPNGVGERTENLAHDISVNTVTAQYSSVLYFDADLKPDTTYVVHVETENEYQFYSNEKLFTTSTYKMTTDGHADWVLTTQSTLDKSNPQQAYNGRWNILKNGRTQSTDVAMTNIMITEGSTIPTSYIPYGYKIPISTLQTVNNYLGSIQSTRQIYKWVLTGQEAWGKQTSSYGYRFYSAMSGHMPSSAAEPLSYCTHVPLGNTYNDAGCYAITATQINISVDSSMQSETEFTAYLAQQYANGTPVTVWYVLQTATTGIVNEPLMKIGTYADSISNAVAIPTTEGANSITVDTTVQPSEFTATWTGWHNASVQEYDGSDWQ